ncbi:MAG: hypothetical protein JRH01_19670 [Deltaproteobacteria bacterium]|nr:hypothetical protein [Deltaproteobacteria bacterium]MBW2394638.1 hypothetical protein [Deltaproteobacteria bacterium]
MRISTSFIALFLGLSLTLGCATTRMLESWKASDLKASDLQFEHVVAIAMVTKETQQRIVEDALVASMSRSNVTPAYSLVSQEDRGDLERMQAALEEHGMDGAVSVRLIRVDERETYVPGTTSYYAGGYYGHYRRVGVPVYDPGYYRNDTYVKVEISLYNVAQGKLLWSGVSETLNPSQVDGLIRGIVEAAGKRLESDGLIP